MFPLLTLVDVLDGTSEGREWHKTEALKLLSEVNVANFASLEDVRRILRRQLLAYPDEPARQTLIEAIRNSRLEDVVKTRELSDFFDTGLLAPEESSNVALCVAESLVDAPEDPRDCPLFRIDRGPSCVPVSHQSNWPHDEDAVDIEILIQTAKESDALSIDDAKSELLEKQLAGLRRLSARDEFLSDDWIGTSLGWCSRVLHKLRQRLEATMTSESRQLTPSIWEATLNDGAPWWRSVADAALHQLSLPVPASHVSKVIVDSRLWWSSNDRILNSLDFLDTLLAIDRTHPYEAYQVRLVAAIAMNWDDWPVYTKAIAFYCLRMWYWSAFPELRRILEKSVTDSESVITMYATERAVELAGSISVPELENFVEHASRGGHNNALRHVATYIGDALVWAAHSGDYDRHAFTQLFEIAMSIDWQDASSFSTFLDGTLVGASDALHSVAYSQRGIERWVELVRNVVQAWPYNLATARFNTHLIFRMLGMLLEEGAKEAVFVQLQDVWAMLMRQGDLPEFCDLHFELKEALMGQWVSDEGGRRQVRCLAMNSSIEGILAAICQTSVERVKAWRMESKTTDDWGWRSGLDGRDSAELITTCMSVSSDKNKMRQALKPAVDVLANAGLTDTASKLRFAVRSL